MGRAQSQKPRDKNQAKLPQTPRRDIVPDGRDIEFAQEFADHDDLEAQKRSREADARAKRK
ncbi:YfhD family protein [Salinibacillus xinjiangensis]|uniref:YfhD family protein n=1 Tax=Salinibacillus xinjiangensis TaxID=1229268 RepID=A0A6G1X4A5_9BACI|nr:YfhD family protein [Salinibacillus xinjiangensis]MRG85821.1 YfhD family protein [Salinibacillus xinjiangensis]